MSTGFTGRDSNGLPFQLADCIILNVGERVKKVLECTNFDEVAADQELQMFRGKDSASTLFALAAAKSAGRGKGFLILTDCRAVFIMHKEYRTGFIEKKTRHVYDFKIAFDYEAIFSVKVGERYLSIDLNNQGQMSTQNFYDIMDITFNALGTRILNPQAKDIIMILVQDRLKAIDEEKKKSRISFVIDFSFLRDTMAKGGITVQSIKCPSCGANVSLPVTGNSFKCAYCGNMVYAQDVFEKMKGLIGELVT